MYCAHMLFYPALQVHLPHSAEASDPYAGKLSGFDEVVGGGAAEGERLSYLLWCKDPGVQIVLHKLNMGGRAGLRNTRRHLL